jgi:GMP synthase-like glutamine amidotransferase
MSNGGGEMNQYPFAYSVCPKKTCLVCDEKKEQVVRIHNQFICIQCEAEMIHSTAHEDLYVYFIEKLKELSF